MHQVSNADPYWPGCNSSPAAEQMQFKPTRSIIKTKLELKTTVLELAYIGCSHVGLYHVGYSLAQWLKSSLTKKQRCITLPFPERVATMYL